MSFKVGDIVVCTDLNSYRRTEVSGDRCYKLYPNSYSTSQLGFYDDEGDFRAFFPSVFRLATLLEKELAE